jgi:hypothetical protein
MELVQSSTTYKLHIKKDGWKMYCGQTFSNKVVDNINNLSSKYSICKSCLNKYNKEKSANLTVEELTISNTTIKNGSWRYV